MFNAKKMKITSIIQVVMCLLAFQLITACGEPQTAKVVSRGNNNGPGGNDEKLAPETGIGLPAFTAIGSLSLQQVTRAISIATLGTESEMFDTGCQSLDVSTVDAKTNKIILKNNRCTSSWSGSETYTVTYTAEDKKVIDSIVKERTPNNPIILISSAGGIDREISITESIKIKRTDTDGVYSFSYNEDRSNNDVADYVITQKRVQRPSGGKKSKKLRENEFNTNTETNTTNADEVQKLRNDLMNGNSNAVGNRPTGISFDGNRNSARNSTRANQTLRTYINVIAAGTVNLKSPPHKWSIKNISVAFQHGDNEGEIATSATAIVPKADGQISILNNCSIPFGAFVAVFQDVTTEKGGTKKYEYIPISITDDGTIFVSKYRHTINRSNCSGKGYVDSEKSFDLANALLKRTSLYTRQREKSDRQKNNRRSSPSNKKEDEKPSDSNSPNKDNAAKDKNKTATTKK